MKAILVPWPVGVDGAGDPAAGGEEIGKGGVESVIGPAEVGAEGGEVGAVSVEVVGVEL